jgi:hypothetical protein
MFFVKESASRFQLAIEFIAFETDFDRMLCLFGESRWI